MPFTNALRPLLLLPVLAACGGGAQELADDTIALYNRVDAKYLDEGFTTESELPETGSARYEGSIVLAPPHFIGDYEGFFGEMTLRTDFGSSTVTGEADNFYAVNFLDEATTMDGSMSITGDIGRATTATESPAFGGTIEGSISDSSDTYRYEADMVGLWVGDDYDYVQLFIAGTMYRNAYYGAEVSGTAVGAR